MTGTATRLGTASKLSYGVGQIAEGLKNTAIATFVLFYYNQVLGLSGTLAGVALGIALIFDAVTDPLAGSLSDNLTSRHGRRHPFMYASALPLGLAFYLLFSPPAGMGQVALFDWLLVMILLTRASMTLYHVPHIALGAELSTDYEERTRVVAYRTFFGTFGGLLAYLVGFTLFFTDARGGQLNAANYMPYALVVSVLMAGTIFWSAWGTRRHVPFLPKAPPGARPRAGAQEPLVPLAVQRRAHPLRHDRRRQRAESLHVQLLLGAPCQPDPLAVPGAAARSHDRHDAHAARAADRGAARKPDRHPCAQDRR